GRVPGRVDGAQLRTRARDPRRKLLTGQVAEEYVGEEQIDRLRPRSDLQRLGGALRPEDVVPGAPQELGREMEDHRLVLGDEDRLGAHERMPVSRSERRGHPLLGRGEVDAEGGTVSGAALHLDVAAALPDESIRGGKTEPRALSGLLG